MKKILNLLVVFSLVLLYSCEYNNSDFDTTDQLTGNALEGGLLTINNPLISYVVGSGVTYSASASAFQGNIQTNSVTIYKQFTNATTGSISNRVILKSIDLDAVLGTTTPFSFTFTYEELIDGLEIDEAPMPTNDGDLNIGDFWSLTYDSTTSQNTVHTNGNFTKVAVGTRYAGIYTVTASSYWNSGGFNGDWNGDDRIIESVDASTYRHVGLAFWDDNEYFFSVDNTTGYITVSPEDLEGNGNLLNTSPIMTCEGAGGPFESLVCDSTTSIAVPDDVDGEDVLKLTTGYFRGTGATREFFENLVKQVE